MDALFKVGTETAIGEHIDWESWQRLERVEQAEQETLNKFVKSLRKKAG